MPETIYIGQDMATAEVKVLFDERDFIDLVAEKLGGDAARFLEDIIDHHSSETNDAYERGRLAGLEENDDATAYNNGREDGYEEGHTAGYAEGYAEGFEDGYKKHNHWV